ncbi:hypothetical protein PCASD_15339 [Puccinia coronata f. sp. avenae]|uniref:C3H1-type domain-containing protein n=1 Tax=Puccinia coronata f. sp. avenae TaxID=200324 RepID=A0A2N5UBC9_9BASI|nr:hypothetical protein PCASD_15339 [Puccinia coronata f. sp. avenae]
MSRPEIVMQTPAAKKLEAEVQRKLAEYSYSTADDVVMAEYVVVMLANAKTPDQITAELSELIGEDMYDPAFTTWLFEEVARQYGISQPTPTLPSPPSPTEALPEPSLSIPDTGDKIQTVNDSRDHHMNYNNNNNNRTGPIKQRPTHLSNPNRPINHSNNNNNNNNRPHQAAVFNQALIGIKRPGPNDILRDSPPHRRLRQDDYTPQPYQPTSRNPRDPHWSNNAMVPNGQRPPPSNFSIGHPMGAESAAKSILERVGVSANPNNPFQNPAFPRGYDQQVPPPFGRPNNLNGAPPSQQHMFYGSPSSYPLPLLPPHPFSQQPFNTPNGPTPQLFLANGQPYIPSHPFQIPGSGPPPMYPSYPAAPRHPSSHPSKKTPGSSSAAAGAPPSSAHPSHPHHHHHQQPASLEKGLSGSAQPFEPSTLPLPTAPLLREECKYNLACKNAWCPSSHCSPKGVPKSSMLLNFQPCELQLKCTDPECLKAHVSPQQADPKASIKLGSKPVGGAGMGAGPNRGPAGSTPNSKAIPCRFGSQCSRPDCAFSHPWIVNNALDRSGSDDALTGAGFAGGIPCKFGLQCSRPDCFYQHPRAGSKNISRSFVNNSAFGFNASSGAGAGSNGALGTPTTATATAGLATGLAGGEKLAPSKKFSAPAPPASSVVSSTNGAAAATNGPSTDHPPALKDPSNTLAASEPAAAVPVPAPASASDSKNSNPEVANNPMQPSGSTPIHAGV